MDEEKKIPSRIFDPVADAHRNCLEQEFASVEAIIDVVLGIKSQLEDGAANLLIPKPHDKSIRNAIEKTCEGLDELEHTLNSHVQWVEGMEAGSWDHYRELKREKSDAGV